MAGTAEQSRAGNGCGRLNHVTERAYDNPKFVEDTVRIAGALGADARIGHFVIEAENCESIHNHSAYALIERAGT